VAWKKISEKTYRIKGQYERVSNNSVFGGPSFRGANPAKTVTVNVSMRINKQLDWVAGLAEGQGAD